MPTIKIPQIKSRTVVPCGTFETYCIVCRQKVILYFNGGELDSQTCCNMKYSLEHKSIEFVVTALDKEIEIPDALTEYQLYKLKEIFEGEAP